ncbi:GerAB/ArcD/ProY family transporter [Bacillus sp. FJAT-49736]|nr:GerAB/ArcD/ProY family transporter [Bacillus sp. FJAT-49736]
MKLSGLQIFWIIFTFETGNMILLTIQSAVKEAKQDTWISYILASLLGMVIIFIACKAALHYPKQSLMEFSKTILGKWLGTFIGVIYLVQWISVIGNILREFADFTITVLLPNTPIWVLILTMLLLMVYVTYVGGIEGIGRCSEVFGPIVILSVILLIFLSINNLNYHQIFPVFFDTGLLPILKGTLAP